MARMQSLLNVVSFMWTMTKVFGPWPHDSACCYCTEKIFVQHLESINESRAAAWIRDTWYESDGTYPLAYSLSPGGRSVEYLISF